MCLAILVSTVYPRVGGGNPYHRLQLHGSLGLSPRGRGKPSPSPRAEGRPGSIPAWAGETCAPPCAKLTATVYPRVGGGNACRPGIPVRGKGLSPRGRGKPSRPSPVSVSVGSIPAWAGETPRQMVFIYCNKVYPRVGGGNAFWRRQPNRPSGLSPRGRGKHIPAPGAGRRLRSIPAWAGETKPWGGGKAV